MNENENIGFDDFENALFGGDYQFDGEDGDFETEETDDTEDGNVLDDSAEESESEESESPPENAERESEPEAGDGQDDASQENEPQEDETQTEVGTGEQQTPLGLSVEKNVRHGIVWSRRLSVTAQVSGGTAASRIHGERRSCRRKARAACSGTR